MHANLKYEFQRPKRTGVDPLHLKVDATSHADHDSDTEFPPGRTWADKLDIVIREWQTAKVGSPVVCAVCAFSLAACEVEEVDSGNRIIFSLLRDDCLPLPRTYNLEIYRNAILHADVYVDAINFTVDYEKPLFAWIPPIRSHISSSEQIK